MRKPTFCICENKDADQLRGNREADQRLCFHYIDSKIPLLFKSKISSKIFCSCTVWFVLDLVRNRFSHNEAHFKGVQNEKENILTLLLLFAASAAPASTHFHCLSRQMQVFT